MLFNNHIEELNRQRERDYIALQLGINPETLDEHPYTLDYATTNDGGIIVAWLVQWDEYAPEGVETEGNPGSLYTRVQPDSEDMGEPDDE